MPNDKPLAHTADGRPIYDNTPTVVCVIVENTKGQILAVRRANEPGKGFLGLPGGYHMRGETWEQAGAREVLEETGVALDYRDVGLMSMVTDEYGNNLVIARYLSQVDQPAVPQDGEALECIWLGVDTVMTEKWAFPRHFAEAIHYLTHHRIAAD